MIKVVTVGLLSLIFAGCTVPSFSDLPVRKEGALIIVCPNGQTFINTGDKACSAFMELDEKSAF